MTVINLELDDLTKVDKASSMNIIYAIYSSDARPGKVHAVKSISIPWQ